MLNCAAMLLAGTMAVGQAEEVGPHYEHVKELEYFLGSWRVTGQFETEFGPLAELTQGKLIRVFSYEWMSGKNFLTLTIREKPRASVEYQAVFGWDPAKSQIKSWDFNAQGAYLEYVHIKKDDGWVLEGTSVYPGGAKGTYRAVITIVDQDTFRHEGSGVMKQDGKETKVTLSYTANRRKPREK
jgi:hypothetical protein